MADPHARVNARLRENGTRDHHYTADDSAEFWSSGAVELPEGDTSGSVFGVAVFEASGDGKPRLVSESVTVNPPRAKSRRGAKKK